MSKWRAGRRPKTRIERYPCGKAKPARGSVLQQIIEAQEAQRLAEEADAKCVALAQPHRRDVENAEDSRLCTALGRFVAARSLSNAFWCGGRDYASLVRRWRAGKAIPGVYTEPRDGDMAEREVEEIAAELDGWAATIARINHGLADLGHDVFLVTKPLVLDELAEGYVVPDRHAYAATVGLARLASEFGHLSKTIHPFHISLDIETKGRSFLK